jgi:PQQ-dependent catabolism-associated CXXCW motif protein
MMPVTPAGIMALSALLLATGAAVGQTLSSAEPQTYRTENYRAPTPATLRGARVVSTVEARAIWKEGAAAFIDVLPRFAPTPNLPAGTLWRGQHRLNIPGSTW